MKCVTCGGRRWIDASPERASLTVKKPCWACCPRGSAQRFKKKPVVIQAVRVEDIIYALKNDAKALPEWLADAMKDGKIWFTANYMTIETLEGSMRATPKDWIVRGVEGELYPCKPRIFKKTYDEIPRW